MAPSSTSTSEEDSCRSWNRRQIRIAAGILALGAAAAYATSFTGAFVFDDGPGIVDNPTIRNLWPLPLWAPANTTPAGRPLVNLSLALNYAVSGQKAWSYHAFNLLVHLLGAFALFGLARRTFRRPALRDRFGAAAGWLGLATALLWLVHPLQTEAVTYVVQRAEAMMGLFYLLTLYGFARGAEEGRRWLVISAGACLLGMLCKEVMVSAPVIVLLYDRTFVAGSFAEAWRKRRGYYLALAATWIPLVLLLLSAGGRRGESSGFDVGVSAPDYWKTQIPALAHYLRLTVWPRPLVFDYGTLWVAGLRPLLWPAVPVALLLAVTLAGFWRRSPLGFAGAWFFAVLAPTSIVPGATQMIVEHRMYLALAPLLGAAVAAAYAAFGRAVWAPFAAAALAGIVLTAHRNQAYRSELALWADTVAKRPESARAHAGFGYDLGQAGKAEEAVAEYRKALELRPGVMARTDLGDALGDAGHLPEAEAEYRRALAQNPNYVRAHNELGQVLARQDRLPEAIAEYQEALRLMPSHAIAHNNLGAAYWKLGRAAEAMAEYRRAVTLDPDYAEAHDNLGLALAGQPGGLPEAISEYRRALALRPGDPTTHNNLGNALNTEDLLPEAIAEYQESLRLEPGYAAAHFDLGCALLKAGRGGEAAGEFRETLRLDPGNAQARQLLGQSG
ncbi:MAG TPA: tetratricopeptide repeat protein [Opitutaceae bacterium]|jgi:tetratricopeptide (TPR) repeat protein|nr:tetratricopeptide repeat protein [Opitutaceae bacterium]